MTTTKFYINNSNMNKFLEVRNDGHSHNKVLQFVQVGDVRTDMANGKFQKIKVAELRELLADYTEVEFRDGAIFFIGSSEPVQENLTGSEEENSADAPCFDEMPEECQNMVAFVGGILEQKFELALVSADGKFRYYVDREESDENASVCMYRDGKLLSDNYFAFSSLFEEMADVHTGKSEPEFISDFLKEAMVSMAENGDFDDEDAEPVQENMVTVGNHNLVLNDKGIPTGIQVVTKGIVRKVSPLYLRDADYSTKTYVSGSVKVIHHLATGKFEICANAVA